MVSFSPSLMGMSILNVKDDISVLDRYFDNLHFDIMDGHYCQNFSLTPGILKEIRSYTKAYIDAHIMATRPNDFIIDSVIDAGANCVSLHPETIWESQYRTINKIHDRGCDAGIVLNPSFPMEAIEHILERIDILTIMTVDIGFSGQKFIPEMYEKIEKANHLRRENNYHYKIQIDGHCTDDIYKKLYVLGADIIIVGNSGLFSLDKNTEVSCQKFYKKINRLVLDEGECL